MRLNRIVAALALVSCLSFASSALGDINGACCIEATGVCTLPTEPECDALGGVFAGTGTNCSEILCVPTVSSWGIASTTLLLLAGLTIKFRPAPVRVT